MDPLRQAFADFLDRYCAARLGVGDTFVDCGKGVIILVIRNGGRIVKVEFVGFGHRPMVSTFYPELDPLWVPPLTSSVLPFQASPALHL